MKKTLALSLLALATVLAPAAARAYPNSAAKHAVAAGGASWTLLQDSGDPLLWYYVSPVARLAEDVKRGPAFNMLIYQAPGPDKEMLLEKARIFLTLTLAPDKATQTELAKAVCALPDMKGVKAEPASIRLEPATISGIKLSLAGDGGKLLAEAAPMPGMAAALSAEKIQFALELTPINYDIRDQLLGKGAGLQVRMTYKYPSAATDKEDGSAGPVSWAPASAEGRVGLGAYPKEIRDRSVTILQPGTFEYAVLALPQVAETSQLAEVFYQVTLLGPDGKQVKGMQAQMVLWKPVGGGAAKAADSGWRDRKGSNISHLLFPLKALYHTSESLEGYNFEITAEATGAKPRTIIKKAKFTTPLLHGDAPIVLSPAPFDVVRISPALLGLADRTSEAAMMAAQFKIQCREKGSTENGTFKKGSEDINVYFPKDCGPIKLEVSLISKTGKRTLLDTVQDVLKETGPLVFLTAGKE